MFSQQNKTQSYIHILPHSHLHTLFLPHTHTCIHMHTGVDIHVHQREKEKGTRNKRDEKRVKDGNNRERESSVGNMKTSNRESSWRMGRERGGGIF